MTAETWMRGDWMQTFTGHRFYPLSPRADEIDPVDIAHALSLLCRYGGHVDRFYSVAEHCVLMSHAVPAEHALWALLHDATEAYVVDVPRPLKRELTDYAAIENGVMAAILARFELPCADTHAHRIHDFRCGGMMPPAVKNADNRILLDETAALMPRREHWTQDDEFEPLGVTIRAWAPGVAEQHYTRRLQVLLLQRDLDAQRAAKAGGA